MTEPGHRVAPNGVVALCGGVGGAKLARGLSHVLGDALTLIVNTGDDFEHLGLHISPDVDTVLYTLSDLASRERGWGREDESWHFLESLRELGGETWFQLGDRDLALHVLRTHALASGRSLTEFTCDIRRRFGIATQILPMCDATIHTIIETTQGMLPFQRYFVEQRCEPHIKGVAFDGLGAARLSDPVVSALTASDLRSVVICPSNPFLSIDPILAVPGMRDLIRDINAPVVGVSPLIGGAAVKGPTGKIMRELGLALTPDSIAHHYDGLLDGLVIDIADAAARFGLGLPVCTTRTLMVSDAARYRLAYDVLNFADNLEKSPLSHGQESA